jgi:hypothetical protein
MKTKSLLGALLLSAAMSLAPVAYTQTVHVAGAAGSSQFLSAALGADQLALTEISNNVNNGTWTPGQKASFHWTAKNSANLIDTRDTLGRILPEVGNVFVVWIADASDATGNTNVTDIWAVQALDATVAVREFSAQLTTGSGAYLQLVPAVAGNLVSPTSLWPDGKADVSLLTAPSVSAAVGTSSTGVGDVHVNVALTDLRPEDALYATTRAIAKIDTVKYNGLGYVGPTANIGAPIYTAAGTGTSATPVKFALSGKADPITKITVPAYTTIPVGASPLIFILNNGGVYSPSTSNLITGVGTKSFPLAHLFDGTTTADTHNPAFGGSGDGAGTPLTIFLREPLSAAMNIAEFSLFRSAGNTSDSQEVGVTNPTRSPYNPLSLGTPGHGTRSRVLSTGEVVGSSKSGASYGLLGTSNSLGYIVFSFANAAKLATASFNYLTLDGVDPLSIPGTVNQALPNGTVTSQAAVWAGGPSFPNLRNGTYKAWSIERYLVPTALVGTDPYGPDALAQSEQDNVDSTSADFVPFYTTGGADGLSVYRSHFTQSGVTGNNGAATSANEFNGGNTLGGSTESGGDIGGAIEGPFGITVPTTNGTATTSSTLTKNKGYKVTWKSGVKFPAGTSWEGGSITLDGASYTIANVALTSTILYVNTNPGNNTTAVPFAADFAYTYPAVTAPGVVNKKQ